MTEDVGRARTTSDEITKWLILFDFLVFHKWLVLLPDHDKFRKTILSKVTVLELHGYPSIWTDNYRKAFTRELGAGDAAEAGGAAESGLSVAEDLKNSDSGLMDVDDDATATAKT